MDALAALLLIIATFGIVWPPALAYPVGAVAVWLAITLLLRARRNARQLKAGLPKPASDGERPADIDPDGV